MSCEMHGCESNLTYLNLIIFALLLIERKSTIKNALDARNSAEMCNKNSNGEFKNFGAVINCLERKQNNEMRKVSKELLFMEK